MTTLNEISLKYQTAYDIITKFIGEGELSQLKCFFKNNAFVYQFVYSTLFLKYFCRIDNKAIESKCCFELAFNNYSAKKKSLIVPVGSDTSDENIKKKQRQT